MPMSFSEYAAKKDTDKGILAAANMMAEMGWTQEMADSFCETFANAQELDEAGFLSSLAQWGRGIGGALGSAWGAARAAQPANQLQGIMSAVDKLAKTFASLQGFEQTAQMIHNQLVPVLNHFKEPAEKAQWQAKAQGAAGKMPAAPTAQIPPTQSGAGNPPTAAAAAPATAPTGTP